MTSTVLDVTVLLLCVSASVVTLGGVGGDAGVRGPTAAETADRLVTETVTVTYRSAAESNDTRTVHATRAELLAIVAETDKESVERRDNAGGEAGESFESRAMEVVSTGLGPRTRVDVRTRAGSPAGRSETATDDRGSAGPRAGRRLAGGVGAPGSSAQPGTAGRDGTATDRDGSDRDARSATLVTVGGEPPRSADVTTAVVTQPAPDGGESTGPVRIVVRRW